MYKNYAYHFIRLYYLLQTIDNIVENILDFIKHTIDDNKKYKLKNIDTVIPDIDLENMKAEV